MVENLSTSLRLPDLASPQLVRLYIVDLVCNFYVLYNDRKIVAVVSVFVCSKLVAYQRPALFIVSFDLT